MPKKVKKAEPVIEAAPDAEPQVQEPPPPEPTEQEKQQLIDAQLQDPTCFAHIALDFQMGAAATSQTMQSYVRRRKQQYLDAHSRFKRRRTDIVAASNAKVSGLASALRAQLTASDAVLTAMRRTFGDDKALQSMSSEEAVNQLWTAMDAQFIKRQGLFDTFSSSARRIEEQRKLSIRHEIGAVLAECTDTGLLPPPRVAASFQCKREAAEQLVAGKLQCYAQLTVRLEDSDAALKTQCEDDFKDGRLRWSQLNDKDKHKDKDTPKAAASKSA